MGKELFVKRCRVCLFPVESNCMSLFENYKNSMLFTFVNSLANIEIKERDGLPSNICKSCFLELEIAISFKEKCQQSNLLLHSEVSQNRTYECETEVFIKKEDNTDRDYEENDSIEFYIPEEIPKLEDKLLIPVQTVKIEVDHTQAIKTEKVIKSKAVDLKLECHDCGNYFKSKCKLKVHWKKVHLPESLVCPNCKRSFKSFKTFNRHRNNPPMSCRSSSNMRIEGKGKKRVFYCKECDYNSKSVDSVRSHLVVHSGERNFKCDLCEKCFTQIGSLYSHKEKAHGEIRVEITCQYCGKFVQGRDRVYRHLKGHRDNSCKCMVCDKLLSNKSSLKQHMMRHKTNKEYTCDVCAKNFYTRADLCNHSRVHKPSTGLVFHFCNQCPFKTQNKYFLRKHILRHTDSNFACGLCNAFFDEEDRLKLHQKNHFIRNKKCQLCPATFACRKNLWRHTKFIHKVPSKSKNPTCIKKEDVLGESKESV